MYRLLSLCINVYENLVVGRRQSRVVSTPFMSFVQLRCRYSAETRGTKQAFVEWAEVSAAI